MTQRPDASPGSRRFPRMLLSGVILLQALLAVGQAAVISAITGDGTLGTTVTRSGTLYDITGGTRPGHGPNLFHSFDRFSVGTGDTARFSASGQTGVVNILSRVTGGQPSAIDGRLQSTFPGANLYLLNPSGVLFGPNAHLEVRGSFHVSTADYLRFADGAQFFAHLGQASVLTVASPTAFGFLGNHPAAITIHGSSLSVAEGKAVSAVGGEVQIVGGALRAPSGRIQLASVASSGEVRFSPLELAPDLQVDGFARLGRLELLQSTLVNASGAGTAGSGGPGGTVLIRSGRMLVDRSSIRADTLGDTQGASLGLDLRVTADAVLANASELRARPRGAGNGGNIVVNVGTLMLTDGSRILTSGTGAGRAGDLMVTAGNALSITGHDQEGDPSGLFSDTGGSGDAGQLIVSAPTLHLEGGRIQAVAEANSQGNAGSLEVRVGRLTLSGGARIDTTTRSKGSGGQLTVTASDAITIVGTDSEGNPSALFSNTGGGGDAGQLIVSAPTLHLEGGRIQALAADNSQGNAGDLQMKVGRLTLSGGAQISVGTRGEGSGGQLTVTASDAITIIGTDSAGTPSGLFNNTGGGGDAGHWSSLRRRCVWMEASSRPWPPRTAGATPETSRCGWGA